MAKRTHAERRAATRGALLDAARAAFSEQGFAGAAREDICARAGVSRGALDHHFEGKRGLFQAVFEELEREQAERIAAAASKHSEPFEQMRAGARAYIDAASDPAIRQIIHMDARAALGFEAWHAVHQRHGVTLLEAPLRALRPEPAAGTRPPSLALLAEMLLAALTAAALHVARVPDSTESLDEALSAIDVMLHAIASPD
jgi:AcrR family transcriptional regulator